MLLNKTEENRSGIAVISRKRFFLLTKQLKSRKISQQSFKMPRVVPDQRSKFENEEFFRKLSRECEASLFIGYILSCGETK